jgi:hypothetical protein
LATPSQIPHPISKLDGQLLLSAPQLSITLSLSGFIDISPPVNEERVDLMQWNGMEGILFSFLALLLDLVVSVGCKVNNKRVLEAHKTFVVLVVDRNFKFRDSLLVAIGRSLYWGTVQ